METVALNPLGIEASRDRQQFGHARHGLVKRRVKAGYLRKFGMTLAERFNQLNFARQMIWVIGADAMQFGQQLRRDNFRLGVLHTVNHAMADGFDRREIGMGFQPVQKRVRR